jgi:hypothetical protein
MDVTQILPTTTVRLATRWARYTSTSAYSRPLAPSRSTCHSALQDSTPQLTTTVRDSLLQRTQDCNAHFGYPFAVSVGMIYIQKFWDTHLNNIQAQFQWVLFMRAQLTQKINRMKFKKKTCRRWDSNQTCDPYTNTNILLYHLGY